MSDRIAIFIFAFIAGMAIMDGASWPHWLQLIAAGVAGLSVTFVIENRHE